MTALIVGGDHIESIRREISLRGMSRIEHWNGRKPGDLRKTLPKGTELVVVLYDSLSHNMLKKVSADTAGSGIPVIHCRRSVGILCNKLDALKIGPHCIGTAEGDADGCSLCMGKFERLGNGRRKDV
jgi:hypothetical protein